jgi:uroporphyrinogen decarboxylase
MPLYEHNISTEVISKIINKPLNDLLNSGTSGDLDEYFHLYADFHLDRGYDTYSLEGCFTELIQNGEGLMGRAGSLIRSEADFNSYPWEELPERYFARFGPLFDAAGKTLPPGMKIVGGVGNGVFETIQDFVPFTDLSYLEIDNPDLFGRLWEKTGWILLETWKIMLERYSDILAVCRFGDDLGFKASTLLKPETIREHVIPWYGRIVELVHSRDKPFLLHSCGAIFDVMDDLISAAGIDAKHSNEDAIAPMEVWIEKYGSRIGNFGGIDMDVLCREDEAGVAEYVTERCTMLLGNSGVAAGSGNQIAYYVPPENFETMVRTIRELRGF